MSAAIMAMEKLTSPCITRMPACRARPASSSGERRADGRDLAFRHPPPLAEVAPRVPPVIARAVDVALSVNPRQRHVSAAAFLAALSETHALEAPPTAGASSEHAIRPTTGSSVRSRDLRRPRSSSPHWR